MLPFDERDRDSVVRDLQSPDEEVRRLAVERVGVLSSDEAIPLLIERLGDEDWRVRKAAVARLVEWADTERVTEALVRALADGENPGRRNAAVEALIHCGARALPRLLGAARASDPDVRKFAVDSLAGIGDAGAVETLIECLGDADANVRAASADALGAIGGERASSALEDAATDEDQDPLVRFSALHALAGLEVAVSARRLGSVLDDPVLRPAGFALLGRLDDDAEGLEVLLKGLGSGARAGREGAARALLRMLGRLDPEAARALAERIRAVAAACPDVVDGCIERLAQADLPTALVLVQLLGVVGEPRAAVPILQAARDEALAQVAHAALEPMGDAAEEAVDAAWAELDPDARRAACQLFGRTRGERGAGRLLAVLDDRDAALRAAAARALGERGGIEAIAPLVRRLEQAALDEEFEGEEERIAVTEALIALASPREGGAHDDAAAARAVELLSSLLHGAAESVRLAVATVLGCIGRREHVELVALLLKDASEQVRRAAVEALARLEPGTAAEPLRLAVADESPAVRIAAARALGASNSEAVFDDLCRLAEDEDAHVRAGAVGAIVARFARSGDPLRRDRVLSVLERAAADEAPVALAAIESACDVGGVAAERLEPLLRRGEPEVVREAVRCLGAHADTAILEGVIPLVSHPDWSVRAEAIHVLADRGMTRAVPAILRRLEMEQDEFVRGETLRALERLEG